MVAIAVLVTRYTPGVQTVKYDDDRTKERTRKWLQSVCCRPGETEDKDGASHEHGKKTSVHRTENEG